MRKNTIEQFIADAESDGTSAGRLVGEYARELLGDGGSSDLLIADLNAVIDVATEIRDRAAKIANDPQRRFRSELEQVSEALWALRARFNFGDGDAARPSHTFAAEIIETIASYVSCVAEDGTWDADTFMGLQVGLERDLSRGVQPDHRPLDSAGCDHDEPDEVADAFASTAMKNYLGEEPDCDVCPPDSGCPGHAGKSTTKINPTSAGH